MLAGAAFLTYSFKGATRSVYLPGPTSDGHYQIELACDGCHGSAFSDQEALQKNCMRCHGSELAEANDSHPERKFTDPRNADRVAQLDARRCVACHREHRPELVSTMGLSLPGDYCYRCHQNIGEERPSHQGLDYFSCQSAGCHNFHDNRALYEEFLARHLDEPDIARGGHNPERGAPDGRRALGLEQADAPAAVRLSQAERQVWARSEHARSGVNCSGCHVESSASPGFSSKVPSERCAKCHADEARGYANGRHGMREAAGLPPLRVADARLPMKTEARERTQGCTACHGAHAFDTRAAQVEACLGCHTDRHSEAYLDSGHAHLFREDPSGKSGASCATCHLPRVEANAAVVVNHNQNDNLRPNEKMVRGVCLRCHGLGFALDSLADEALVARNFRGRPARHVRSLDMVRARQMR
jgi:hypothetical protein